MNIAFRQATKADIEFLVEGIIHAEMSGGDILPYTALFGLTIEETQQLIKEIFEEEIDGQEWHIPHFQILTFDGVVASCLSYWTEGANGNGSGVLKAQAMSWLLREKWTQAEEKLSALKSLQLSRVSMAMQLECIYTKKQFRGLGLASKLIEHCIAEQLTMNPQTEFAEIQLLGNNTPALQSYTKCGFLIRDKITSSNPEILNLLTDNTRISLTKKL